jgi:hypothetical protein
MRRLNQEFIAGAMTQAVIDDLEAVEVEKQHRELMVRARMAALDGLLQPLVEAASIGQVGQAIVIGDVLQLLGVLGGLRGFALRGLEAALAAELDDFLLAKIVMQRGQ